tara:strand:+ start:3646 stop:4194 length:549 start_codon:yes stop_codon:yes gene_type:complete
MQEKEAVAILKKYAPNPKTFQVILQHGKAVQQVAVIIAQDIKRRRHKVDLQLVKMGCLLHDMGHFWYPPKHPDVIRHGLKAAQILKKEGFPKLAKIAERHIGVGISKQDIIKGKLNLPKRDMLPKTIEEKIIAYADNMIHGDRISTVRELSNMFKKFNKDVRERAKNLHNEIEKLRGGKEFI